MTTFNLIKTKAGERKGTLVSTFIGESANDAKMLSEVKKYLVTWLNSYTSISDEEISEFFENFGGDFSYDVWNFALEIED
jgi:hypothetical protein